MTYHMPKVAEIKSILDMLISGLKVTDGNSLDLSVDNNICGVFVDDSDTPVAMVVCDFPLGVYLGAALTMIPPPVAKETAQAGELSGMIKDSLQEVMNILSRLFMTKETKHLRFETLYLHGDLPEEARILVRPEVESAVFDMVTEKYGGGAIGFFIGE